MPYNVEVRPLATAEIIEAYDWYQLQKEGLGEEFLAELEAFYNNLLSNPFAHSFYEEPVRQGKLNRFPYVVVYEVFDKKIIIYSVFMTRRNPERKRESH